MKSFGIPLKAGRILTDYFKVLQCYFKFFIIRAFKIFLFLVAFDTKYRPVL